MTKQRKVSIDTLVIGARLNSEIPDPENSRVRLLAEGTVITADFIDRLKHRGVQSVLISERDVATLNAFLPQGQSVHVAEAHEYVRSHAINEQTLLLDQRIDRNHQFSIDSDAVPFENKASKREDCPYEDGLQVQWAAEASEAIDSIENVYDEVIESRDGSATSLHLACHDILKRMTEDVDALVCLACNPFESAYPARHGFHVAAMAMAIGARMNLDEATLIDLGVGCMVHDVGMRAIGLGMFRNNRPLTDGQLKLLSDHPVKGADVIGKFGEQVSFDAKMVAFQLHERGDASGYPRGRAADQIHPLAKIAAVADAFVGMVAPRPHRSGSRGYHAIVSLLSQTKLGKFDAKVMRALLEVTSLHPLGSFVDLNNQCVGRVIRSAGGFFDKPTIQMWPKDAPNAKPEIVNLMHEEQIQIVRSAPLYYAA